jgi:predicted nucleic acid-binding protein
MVVVDSGVWIDLFAGRENGATAALARLLDDGQTRLVLPDLVLFEVLRGFRDERDFNAARRTLAELPVVEIGGAEEALRAAQHYRALRAQGRTIRSPIDVLLASYCIENDCALLHSDRDFDVLESLRGLKVWRH